ncbi:MAG: cupin domain-containing protein [Hyphomicrobiaceae bacterium]
MQKSKPRVVSYAAVPYAPRFAYGDQCQIGPVAGSADGAEMACGYALFEKARIPWTITYDEVLFVVEGELTVHANGEALKAGPKDSIWLPAGTELVYEAERAVVAYAVHPLTSTPGARKS